MKKAFLWRALGLLALALLAVGFVPQPVQANAYILFHTEHVYLNSPGEATVEGYFENTGDSPGTVEWLKMDLELTDEDGDLMWSDVDIYHYPDYVEVDAGDYVPYTFYIQNADIPEYHRYYRWHTSNNRTHWSNAVG